MFGKRVFGSTVARLHAKRLTSQAPSLLLDNLRLRGGTVQQGSIADMTLCSLLFDPRRRIDAIRSNPYQTTYTQGLSI